MKEIIKKIEGLGGKVFLVTLKATYLLVKGLVGFIKDAVHGKAYLKNGICYYVYNLSRGEELAILNNLII